jgi:organic radical activating enzyme
LRQGEPTIFVRLAGCNLRCGFCDTREAWDGGHEWPTGRIVEAVRALHADRPCRWVCLTGGEPLLQEISPLLRSLKGASFRTQIETNATQPPQGPADWYTVSPKPPDYRVHPDWPARARELKLVVTRELSPEVLLRLSRRFPAETPLILQPESNRTWSLRSAEGLLGEALKAGRANIRISLQLHKLMGIR